MLAQSITTIALLVSAVTAHFSIEYPQWRGDSFATGASQYIYPYLHHPWTYLFVNLGLGTDYPIFNISLTTQPLNETGNGTLCLPQIVLPASVAPVEGQNASIQVVTFGATGSALYNCADITFSSNATILEEDACRNSSNVMVSVVEQEVNGSTSTTSSAAAGSSTAASGAIAGSSVGVMGLGGVIGVVAGSFLL